MAVRSHRLFVLLLCSVALALGGCCSRCGSTCAPQGPWQSPTIQATRALMVVNTEELRILRIDGRNVHPSCIGADGVREYHIPAGMHTITATFRYAAPVSGGLVGAVWGVPMTQQRQFLTGHEYVPVYRQHARTATAGSDRYWSLNIADLAQAGPDPEPEVREAKRYCAVIRGLATTADRKVSSGTY